MKLSLSTVIALETLGGEIASQLSPEEAEKLIEDLVSLYADWGLEADLLRFLLVRFKEDKDYLESEEREEVKELAKLAREALS